MADSFRILFNSSIFAHSTIHFIPSAPNPSSLTLALWLTQPVTEMSTGRLLGVKRGRRKADNLTTICEPIV
jgi:hypothetical protein